MSSGKFHISNDGNVRACRAASEASCTAQGLGGRHFDSKEEGREAVEKILGGTPAPKITKKKTRLEKLAEDLKEARAAEKKIVGIHTKKLADFSKVEKIVLAGALGEVKTSDATVASYVRLKSELEVISKERERLTKARRAADDEYSREERYRNPPARPVYGGGSYSSGGCGGGGC